MSDARRESFQAIRSPNLVDQVASHLAEAIIAGRFLPGERLSEVALARELGVSRAPIREAARLLESRGLLVSQPRRGFFVRALDAAELEDIFDLRLCLERHAMEHLAHDCSAEAFEALQQQVEVLCEAAVSGSEGRRIEEDLTFHRLLVEAVGNRRLLKSFDDLAHELRLCITLITRTHDAPETIADSHHLLLEALASRDSRRCREAIDYHIGVARDHVVRGVGDARTFSSTC